MRLCAFTVTNPEVSRQALFVPLFETVLVPTSDNQRHTSLEGDPVHPLFSGLG
jgi:hypothetical protein